MTGPLRRTATTDGAGKAAVSLPALGELQIKVRKGSLVFDEFLRAPALPVHRMRVFLGRPGAMTVHVTNVSGSPIGGARIFLDGSGLQGKTSEDGQFRLDEVSAGDHRVTVKASGQAKKRQIVTVKPGTRVLLRFALEKAGALDLTCQCGGDLCNGANVELNGAFTDPTDPDSEVDDFRMDDSFDESTYCDEGGRVFRDDLPAGPIQLTGVFKPRTAGERRGEMAVTIVAGQVHRAVLRFEKSGDFAGWLEGTVRTHDGKLAASATVDALCTRAYPFDPIARRIRRADDPIHGHGETITDARGRFRIDHLTPGLCALRAWPGPADCPLPACSSTPPATLQEVIAPARVDIQLRDPRAERKPGNSDYNHDRP